MADKTAAWVRAGAAAALALVAAGADAQGFVPPAGYGGTPGPGVATPVEPGSPALTRIPDANLQNLFRVDPAYPRAAAAHARVVGAFAVAEPAGAHFTGAWAQGFMPVTLAFSDGQCFALSADYVGGTLSNGRLHRVGCEPRRKVDEPPPPPPRGRRLRLVGPSWGFVAWADDRAGTTIVTTPFAKTFQPFFTARMRARVIMAMHGLDWPGGNVTLVGRVAGRLTVVTLEVSY